MPTDTDRTGARQPGPVPTNRTGAHRPVPAPTKRFAAEGGRLSVDTFSCLRPVDTSPAQAYLRAGASAASGSWTASDPLDPPGPSM
jgi:hypothetical protein